MNDFITLVAEMRQAQKNLEVLRNNTSPALAIHTDKLFALTNAKRDAEIKVDLALMDMEFKPLMNYKKKGNPV